MSDLVRTLDDLKAAGIDLYLHGQGLDTSTPTGKALFGMLGVFAEFERSMIVARVKAGLERAKATGTRTGNSFGRPALSTRKTEIARTALANGASVRAAAGGGFVHPGPSAAGFHPDGLTAPHAAPIVHAGLGGGEKRK
jgi:DNA invertase Pin-like site-specific DNA recombinase